MRALGSVAAGLAGCDMAASLLSFAWADFWPPFDVYYTVLMPNNPDESRIVYAVRSRNPALGEWVAAKWDLDISFDVFKGEKHAGGTIGTIKVEFRKVDAEEK